MPVLYRICYNRAARLLLTSPCAYDGGVVTGAALFGFRLCMWSIACMPTIVEVLCPAWEEGRHPGPLHGPPALMQYCSGRARIIRLALQPEGLPTDLRRTCIAVCAITPHSDTASATGGGHDWRHMDKNAPTVLPRCRYCTASVTIMKSIPAF